MKPTTIIEADAADDKLLRDLLGRVSVVVVELEAGETSVAYQVATDLELDLEAALFERARGRASLRIVPEAA